MSHEEYMKRFKQVSKEEYETFIKEYSKKHETINHFFMDWYDTYDNKTMEIIARNYFNKYYILKDKSE